MVATISLKEDEPGWKDYWLGRTDLLYQSLSRGALFNTHGFGTKRLFDIMGLSYKNRISLDSAPPEIDFFLPQGELKPERSEALPLKFLTLSSKILQIKWINQGEAVSYGHTWTAPRRSCIATVALGYGDGYPRALSNCGSMTILGNEVPVVGRVCMDLTMLNLTDHPALEEIRPGNYVDAIGGEGPSWHHISELINWPLSSLIGGIGSRVERQILGRLFVACSKIQK